ncbi:transmembrane protein 187-like [Ornithodoros turicata]|uniref:transmembrane protein 187-like n=1 Tax=Ornithodoros turicata TaxID=34597 RepID=UPI0031387D8E
MWHVFTEFLPVLNVTVGYAIICTLAAWGIFDDYDVEVDFEMFGEYPSVFAHRLPPFIKMPFNTLVNALYVVCGFFWLRKIRLEEETDSKEGPVLMPLEEAYYFRVYGWVCIYYSAFQLMTVLRPHYRVVYVLHLSRLVMLSWLIVWSVHLLDWARSSVVLCIGGPLLSLMNFMLLLGDPNGYNRVLVTHLGIASTLVAYMQAVYGDVSHSLTSLGLVLLLSVAFWITLKTDLMLAQTWPMPCRVLTGYFWSRVCEVALVYLMAQFMFAILVNKYVDQSLQYKYEVPHQFALYKEQ